MNLENQNSAEEETDRQNPTADTKCFGKHFQQIWIQRPSLAGTGLSLAVNSAEEETDRQTEISDQMINCLSNISSS